MMVTMTNPTDASTQPKRSLGYLMCMLPKDTFVSVYKLKWRKKKN